MSEYEDAHAKYAALADKAAKGDKQAKIDKAKAFQEVRSIEREAARKGTQLSAGKVIAEGDAKRSLQEEYCRKFDDEAPVNIGGKTQTMRQFHRKRLLGK